MKNSSWISIASIYVGTVIGAGFASGREIMNFFGNFGFNGLIGICISTILFSIIGCIILTTVYKNNINSYDEFLSLYFGKNLTNVIDLIMLIFLFAGYCIMLAGSGSIFYEQFHISHNIGIIFMAAASLFTFLYSVKGISIVNTIIVPVLLFGIVFMGGFIILDKGIDFSNLIKIPIINKGNWIISSITYVSYNMIPSLVILTSIGSIIDKKETAVKGGIIGGFILGMLAIFILIPCFILYNEIHCLDIPMLHISSYLSHKGKFMYSIILWFAMFTTAIGNGFGFIKRVSCLIRISEKLLCILFSFMSIYLAGFGFSNLISILYPIFGYLGFLIIIMALFKYLKSSCI